MVLVSPRLHLFEINDQAWFPAYFREKVQACLTLMWTFRLPILQSTSPATLVATKLQQLLGERLSDYTYVDFCAGAGGPTPFIEQELNKRLGLSKPDSLPQAKAATPRANGLAHPNDSVDFILTDIAPHLPAWQAASTESAHLHYIPKSVDASAAPTDLLSLASSSHPTPSPPHQTKKIFRLFNLAFHHFPDPLATRILHNTLNTSSGFAIFELQARTLSSFLTITLMWPLLLLITPFYFWRSPGHLFFTYLVPVIPFVLVFDGYVSSLRTRTAEEVLRLADAEDGHSHGGGAGEGWEFKSGDEWHTWPIGEMGWLVAVKQSG